MEIRSRKIFNNFVATMCVQIRIKNPKSRARSTSITRFSKVISSVTGNSLIAMHSLVHDCVINLYKKPKYLGRQTKQYKVSYASITKRMKEIYEQKDK